MSIEREWKLDASPELELPDLADPRHGVSVGAPMVLHLDATYYDTPDLALIRAGLTVRYRTGEAEPLWTVKLPVPTTGALLSRREIELAGEPDVVPHAVGELVRGYSVAAGLVPVARVRTDRRQFRLAAGEEVVGIVCDDDVIAEADGAVHRFREIECELGDGADPRVLRSVRTRLRDAGCRPADPTPKVLRALGAVAREAPDVVVPHVGTKPTLDDVVRRSVAVSVRQLVEHHGPVRIGDDPEAVHRFRVGIRRLRSDLRTFAPLLDASWSEPLRDELAWLGGVVGVVRDADVLGGRFRARLPDLPSSDGAAAGLLLDHLAVQAAQARAELLASLASDRYLALLGALVDATRTARYADGVDAGRVGEHQRVLGELVRTPWRRLTRTVADLGNRPTDEQLHLVRIGAKRARYAAEAVECVLGSRSRLVADALAAVQDVLGEHQDSIVAEAWLRTTAGEIPDAALVCGALMALAWRDRARTRKRFRDAWADASEVGDHVMARRPYRSH